jgi:flagellar M-ring protein FliF
MEKPIPSTPQYRQIRLILLIFGGMLALLALAYYLFIRTDYAVLYSGLRPADASAIVAELDSKGVTYALRDDGTTILVPVDEVDGVRLAIVRSDAPLKGSVGFELFNKSDMGLTDFAQKINYQRALQGELSRTIMMLDGIEDARVHLAIPERSLFRGNRSEPKAAVTISVQRGRTPDDARVAGIQRLVAAAVPDLALSAVVVLDELGRVISQSAEPEGALPAAMEERAAVQQYYRARVRNAVENILPGLKFDVRILALSLASDAAAWDGAGRNEAGGGASPPAETADGSGQGRDFRLRVMLVTTARLNPEDQNLVRNAVADAVRLSPEAGDALEFAVGPLTGPLPAPPAPISTASAGASADFGPARAAGDRRWSQPWLAVLAVLAAAILLVLAWRARASGLSAEERDAFIQRIRRQLGPAEEGGDVRT